MIKACKNCSENFEITPDDIAFYKKVSPVFSGKTYLIPNPTFCPDCRQQRRLSWRNERSLHHRTCDATGKKIISMYDDQQKFPVYDNDFWWSDKWDPLKYGVSFDFSQNFFSQFQILFNTVPNRSLVVSYSTMENSDFTNHSTSLKNCYLITDSINDEDCYFGTTAWGCSNVLDFYNTKDCSYCYEVINCENCMDVCFSENSKSCSNSWFLKNCISCSDCFGCHNLNNKQYYIFNKKYSKYNYEKMMKSLEKASYSSLKNIKKSVPTKNMQDVVLYLTGKNNSEVSGDFLNNCKNAQNCFTSSNLEDCKNCYSIFYAKDCHDYNAWGQKSEQIYECEAIGESAYNILFCNKSWSNIANLMYSTDCFSSKNCFGCVGLKNAEYCIFNKQYTKEEYEKLVPKIIEHMQKTGEWGEFFPSKISPFAYNETVAQEYFPLTKSEIIEKGLKYKEEKSSQDYMGPKVEIPDDIKDVDESICQKILQCEISGKLYKITLQELKFYKKMNIPIPRKCPDQRHKERMSLRNPRKLFERKCDNCEIAISTTYAPERLEKVFCEKCYLESVY